MYNRDWRRPVIPYPHIDPEIVRIGPFAVRWYGMMYLLAFVASYLLVRYQIVKKKLGFHKDFIETLYSFIIIGLLLGARIGYVLVYNFSYYIHHPFEIFAVWQGGMSFHGGFVGCVLAGILFCKRFRCDFWQIADLVIVTAPVGLGLGRLGNFINGELYGRVSDVPWAMVFPSGGPSARHPSQLYEFFLEGVVLFVILWILKDKNLRSGLLSSLFIVLYGAFRFIVEFFREPDVQIGYLLGFFTMGQVLCLFMIVVGAAIFYLRQKA